MSSIYIFRLCKRKLQCERTFFVLEVEISKKPPSIGHPLLYANTENSSFFFMSIVGSSCKIGPPSFTFGTHPILLILDGWNQLRNMIFGETEKIYVFACVYNMGASPDCKRPQRYSNSNNAEWKLAVVILVDGTYLCRRGEEVVPIISVFKIVIRRWFPWIRHGGCKINFKLNLHGETRRKMK